MLNPSNSHYQEPETPNAGAFGSDGTADDAVAQDYRQADQHGLRHRAEHDNQEAQDEGPDAKDGVDEDGEATGWAEQMVDINDLEPAPHRLKEPTPPDEAFVQSLQALGMVVPLTVVRQPGKEKLFQIVDGHRRYEAALQLGFSQVPARSTSKMSQKERLLHQAAINSSRRDLSNIEKSYTAKKLRKHGYALDKIAAALGLSIRSLTEIMKVFDTALPELQRAVDEKVSGRHVPLRVAARAAGLDTAIQQEALPQLLGTDRISGMKVIRQIEKKKGISRSGRKAKPLTTVNDAEKRALELLERASTRQAQGLSDPRIEAHIEVLEVVLGRREPAGDLYESRSDTPRYGNGSQDGTAGGAA